MRKSNDLFAQERNLRQVFRDVEKTSSTEAVKHMIDGFWRSAMDALPRLPLRTLAK